MGAGHRRLALGLELLRPLRVAAGRSTQPQVLPRHGSQPVRRRQQHPGVCGRQRCAASALLPPPSASGRPGPRVCCRGDISVGSVAAQAVCCGQQADSGRESALGGRPRPWRFGVEDCVSVPGQASWQKGKHKRCDDPALCYRGVLQLIQGVLPSARAAWPSATCRCDACSAVSAVLGAHANAYVGTFRTR